MINLSGTPGVKTTITDLSVIIANSLKGIICVQGITSRGEAGKEELVTNWTEFRRKFGSLIDGDKFPLYCKHALENGAKLRVSRAHHYSDIDDLATVDGDLATGIKTVIGVAETPGTMTYTITNAGADTNTIALKANPDSVLVTIAEAVSATGDDVDDVANKCVIDCLTKNAAGTHGFTAAKGAGAGEIDITAPAGYGATANGWTPSEVVTGSLTATHDSWHAGVDAVISSAVTYLAKGVGDGYDGAVITTVASKSGVAGYIDFTVSLPDSDIDFTVENVSSSPSTAQLAAINSQLEGVEISTFTNIIPAAAVTLAAGDQTIASIVAADYTGSATSKAGWHAFDEVVDSMRIMNLNSADADVDIGLVAYVVARTDMRAVTRTPLGLTASGVDDYRNGEGVYSHTAIDSLYADLWYTDVEITDPDNPLVKDLAVSAIGHYAGLRAAADNNFGEWFAAAGSLTGKMSGINKVAINFVSPGNSGQYDSLYELGINAIVNHPTFGICSWGNRSLLQDRTKLTSKQNIADMVVFIARTMKGLAEEFSFQPNDFVMFGQLYRKMLPFIRNVLVGGRAIQGDTDALKGEGVWWHYFGDQFATNPDELSFNTKEDIDAGKYRIRFAFKPIAANEYIAIDIAPADSATIKNIQVLKTL